MEKRPKYRFEYYLNQLTREAYQRVMREWFTDREGGGLLGITYRTFMNYKALQADEGGDIPAERLRLFAHHISLELGERVAMEDLFSGEIPETGKLSTVSKYFS